MKPEALLKALRRDPRKGLLLVAEQLGSRLVGHGSLQELARVITGLVPQDERSRGIREALLELLSAAEAARMTAVRRRPPVVVAKDSWKEVLGQLADGNVHQLTKIAAALGENKKGSVSNVLDELEEEGLVEPAVGPGMAKNARHVRLSEGGLAFVATLAPTKTLPEAKRASGSADVAWLNDVMGSAFAEVIDLDSCRVAQNRSTLVFDLGHHPERSWDELDVHTVVLLAQVLGEASHDPMRGLRLSRALDLARPESEFTAELVPKALRPRAPVGRTADDE